MPQIQAPPARHYGANIEPGERQAAHPQLPVGVDHITVNAGNASIGDALMHGTNNTTGIVLSPIQTLASVVSSPIASTAFSSI